MHCPVMNDIRTLNADELEDLYAIEIYEDGTVWDLTEGRMFDDLHDWALFTESLEDEDNFAHASRIGSKARWDDGGF